MSYRADPRDRAKSLALVVVLHIALGAALLFGLAGDKVRHVTDSLKSFDVREDEPPPPPPPKQDSASAARHEAAPPDLRAKPSPILAPKPPQPLPVPSPVRTASEPGPEGADRSAGAAAVAGPGTGAGGSGSGSGGGGRGGDGSGSGLGREARYVPGTARARLPRSIIDTAPYPTGRLPLRLSITPAGRVGSCIPLASSGSPVLDAELCRSIALHSRWVPALDRQGRPVTVELVFNATWSDR